MYMSLAEASPLFIIKNRQNKSSQEKTKKKKKKLK